MTINLASQDGKVSTQKHSKQKDHFSVSSCLYYYI